MEAIGRPLPETSYRATVSARPPRITSIPLFVLFVFAATRVVAGTGRRGTGGSRPPAPLSLLPDSASSATPAAARV